MDSKIKDALKRIDFGKDWWGKVELTIRDGKVTLAEEKQTTKMD